MPRKKPPTEPADQPGGPVADAGYRSEGAHDSDPLDPVDHQILELDSEDLAAYGIDTTREGLDLKAYLSDEERENARIEIRRVKPRTMIDPATGQEIDIAGYIDDLPDDVLPYNWIMRRFGGGVYILQLKVNNRFNSGYKIEISGPPRRFFAFEESAKKETPEPERRSNIDPETEALLQRVEKTMILKHTLEGDQPKDPSAAINMKLLEMALANSKPEPPKNPLEYISELRDVFAMVKDFAKDDQKPEEFSLGGVVQEGIKLINHTLANRQPINAAPPAAPHNQLPPPTAPNPATDAAPVQEESAQMQFKETADECIDIIVTGYMMNPRTAPDHIARLLDIKLDLGTIGKKFLTGYHDELEEMARQEYDRRCDPPPTDLVDLAAYFNEIFNLYLG